MTIKDDAYFAETSYHHRTDAPVFDTGEDWRNASSALPVVWISERVEDAEGNYLGRTFVDRYPDMEYDDEGGWTALEYGAHYYNEGMVIFSLRTDKELQTALKQLR